MNYLMPHFKGILKAQDGLRFFYLTVNSVFVSGSSRSSI